MVNAKYKVWWASKSGIDRLRIAKEAFSSRSMLYQVAINGRVASAELAGRLEVVSNNEINRGDACSTCRRCPYYRSREHDAK